jgi:hypothetical protein
MIHQTQSTNRKTWLRLLLALGVTLALAGGVVVARRVQAQETGPQEQRAPEFAVDTAFTYQGRLINNDTPVNGTCDLKFTLYDDNQLSPGVVDGPVENSNVTVSDGYLATRVDFGSDAFTGEGRQLGVDVRCPAGSGNYTPLSGLVTLDAAPYAHSLRPGAVISSTDTALNVSTSATAGSALNAQVTTSSGNAAAVYGTSSSTGGAGLSGRNSSNGYGVYGFSSSGHGVHGQANPPDGYGIYSEGNAYVEGELFWEPKTSYVSIAPAAFIPESDSTLYANEGDSLQNQSASGEWFAAPVQLPHGATVTKLQVAWRDASDTEANVYLRRRSMNDLTAPFETLAQVTSVGSLIGPQQGVWSDDSIDNAPIDNASYIYYLEAGMQDGSEDIQLKGVIIVYEITEPY